MERCIVLLVLAYSAASASPLFEDDAVLDVVLEGPIRTVRKDNVERREQPFVLQIDDKDLPVAVRVRGNSRVVHCDFPPLRLNFSSSDTGGSVFDGQKKIKLVTHCRLGAKSESNVLEEYAAYRIFNALTDMSFRTRLLRIRYVDSEQPGGDELVRYGFLIEPDKALAARHSGELLKVPHVTSNLLDKDHSALGYVFQYLIGNTDWSHVRFPEDEWCCHNGNLVGVGERHYYVPYDFDMAGLISASYAQPQPELGLRNVRIRRYRGYCTNPDTLAAALRAVAGARGAILKIIEDLPGSNTKETESRSRYLLKFFEAAEDSDKLLRDFERRCLG